MIGKVAVGILTLIWVLVGIVAAIYSVLLWPLVILLLPFYVVGAIIYLAVLAALIVAWAVA